MTNSERLIWNRMDSYCFRHCMKTNRSRTSASTNSTELIVKKSSLACSSSLTSAGAAPVWNWCCGAPQRTLSPRGWRTLYTNSSASSWQWADRLPPLYPTSAAPHPNPSSQHPVSRLSARCSAALRSSTLERKTWSYRGKPLHPMCEKTLNFISANKGITIRSGS